MAIPRLDRSSWPAPARPVRIVHLGIGNFARAHQAWYTMAADGAGEWGISAFTGRRPDAAALLAPQQGLYTLIERGTATDGLSVIEVVSEVRPGSDRDGFTAVVAAAQTALVTLTVTEAGYRPTAAAERAAAGADGAGPTPPERLAAALVERHRRQAPPLAIVSCDNLHANGSVLRELVLDAAERFDADAATWIAGELSFVSTSVDRITPRVGDAERELVARELGLSDAAPVVTEPFSDWILSGEFPGGRPQWELAGARFVADIEPWELRKLWMLNGAHSLLAFLGLLRGYGTVAEAIRDQELVRAMEEFWDLAARYLPLADQLELDAYRDQLHARFANARMGYPLTQIAGDGLDKLRQRVVPVISAAGAAGESAEPAMRVLRAWAQWLCEDPARADSDQNGALLRRVLSAGDDTIAGLLKLMTEGDR
ncbi:MAG: mannitol dehydrogenase family protein [Acidobacteriota bacterium]|nr:mannitol dehydrogenase family protein [Acidobacteriota bacterium]